MIIYDIYVYYILYIIYYRLYILYIVFLFLLAIHLLDQCYLPAISILLIFFMIFFG